MKKLAIHFLPHSRKYLMIHTLKQFSRISNELKKYIKIFIHNDSSEDFVKGFVKGFDYEIINHNSHEYMKKIYYAVNTEFEYSMKIDEDIFMNSYVLEYIISNLNCLDDKKNLILTPTLSTGIPTSEFFIEDFCPEYKKEIFGMFSDTYINNFWNVDYSSLNYKKEIWDKNIYYDFVKNINHHYKGIHPIRINYDIQKRMIEIIKDKKENLIKKNNYYIETLKFPYICNSVFVIKTDIWRKIINNKYLFRDEYDEVPLNLYKEENKLNLCIIRNSNCVHPVYNTVDLFINNGYNNLSLIWNDIIKDV